jgi:hypothetical protein
MLFMKPNAINCNNQENDQPKVSKRAVNNVIVLSNKLNCYQFAGSAKNIMNSLVPLHVSEFRHVYITNRAMQEHFSF